MNRRRLLLILAIIVFFGGGTDIALAEEAPEITCVSSESLPFGIVGGESRFGCTDPDQPPVPFVMVGHSGFELYIAGTELKSWSAVYVFYSNCTAIPCAIVYQLDATDHLNNFKIVKPLDNAYFQESAEYAIMIYNDPEQAEEDEAVGWSNEELFTVYNTPPTASVLSAPITYCPPIASQSVASATFKWTYADAELDTEKFLRIQISSSSSIDAETGNFVSPQVDRSYDGLSDPSPTEHEQQVNVKITQQTDSLIYNTTYHWQVKVCQNDYGGARIPSFIDPVTDDYCSGWQPGLDFTTPAHAYPWPAFTFSDTSPAVNFTDASSCYDSDGICNAFNWDFGDGVTSTIKSPTHTYATTGSYLVTQTVTDGDGFQCLVEQTTGAPNPSGIGLPFWKETNPLDFNLPLAGPGEPNLIISVTAQGGDDFFDVLVAEDPPINYLYSVVIVTTSGLGKSEGIVPPNAPYTVIPDPPPTNWVLTGNTCQNVFVTEGYAYNCTLSYVYTP